MTNFPMPDQQTAALVIDQSAEASGFRLGVAAACHAISKMPSTSDVRECQRLIEALHSEWPDLTKGA